MFGRSFGGGMGGNGGGFSGNGFGGGGMNSGGFGGMSNLGGGGMGGGSMFAAENFGFGGGQQQTAPMEKRATLESKQELQELQQMLGGEFSLSQLQQLLDRMSTTELTQMLTKGGISMLKEFLRSLDGGKNDSNGSSSNKGDGGSGAGGTDFKSVASSIVDSLVGNQLGGSGNQLMKDMIGKVESLLQQNLGGDIQQTLLGMLGKGVPAPGEDGGTKGSRSPDQFFVKRKIPSFGENKTEVAGLLGNHPRSLLDLPNPVGLTVFLGIEKDRTQKHAGFGYSFSKFPSWDCAMLTDGTRSDRELILEAASELVLFLAAKFDELAKETVKLVKCKLVAGPQEIARINSLTKGEWARFIPDRIKSEFPEIQWIPVKKQDTTPGLFVARQKIEKKFGSNGTAGLNELSEVDLRQKAMENVAHQELSKYAAGGGGSIGEMFPDNKPKSLIPGLKRSFPSKSGGGDEDAKAAKTEMRCFKCDEPGHFANDCTNPRKQNPDRYKDFTCKKCWQMGHIMKDCTNPRAEKPAPRSLVTSRPLGSSAPCMLCSEIGHSAADCPVVRKQQHQLEMARRELMRQNEMDERSMMGGRGGMGMRGDGQMGMRGDGGMGMRGDGGMGMRGDGGMGMRGGMGGGMGNDFMDSGFGGGANTMECGLCGMLGHSARECQTAALQKQALSEMVMPDSPTMHYFNQPSSSAGDSSFISGHESQNLLVDLSSTELSNQQSRERFGGGMGRNGGGGDRDRFGSERRGRDGFYDGFGRDSGDRRGGGRDGGFGGGDRDRRGGDDSFRGGSSSSRGFGNRNGGERREAPRLKDGRAIECFKCGGPHRANDCRDGPTGANSTRSDGGGGGSFRGGLGRRDGGGRW